MKFLAITLIVPMLIPVSCTDDESAGSTASGGGSANQSAQGGTASDSTAPGLGGTAPRVGGTTGSGGTGSTSQTSSSAPNFNDTLTGSPCTVDADCGSFGGIPTYCKLDWIGGYCTASCVSFSDCPRKGDSCNAASSGSTETICVRACDEGTICRPGYTCLLRHCFPPS